MRYLFFLCFLFSISFSFSQDNHIVKTDDGRRVLLKADFTWEYIDLVAPANNSNTEEVAKPKIDEVCKLPNDFEEPKLNAKIQSQLKKGRATISHVKKKVAKDYDCSVSDITLISAREQKEKGTYSFCVKGKKVSYKRIGSTIIKKGNLI